MSSRCAPRPLCALAFQNAPRSADEPHRAKCPLLPMQAMVFVRPTRENITLLKKELKAPRFQSYSICGCMLGRAAWRPAPHGAVKFTKYRPCARLNPPHLSCFATCSEPADFTNLVNPIHLQELAEADAVKEQVQEVQVCTWEPGGLHGGARQHSEPGRVHGGAR